MAGSSPFRRQAAWYLNQRSPKRASLRATALQTRHKPLRAKVTGSRKKRHLTAAQRKAISLRQTGKKHPHKGVKGPHRAYHLKHKRPFRHHPHKGHKMSASTRAKISKSLAGRRRKKK